MRCGCPDATACLCALTAGDGLSVYGSGASGDPYTLGLALSTDVDQEAVILASKLLVHGGGPRSTPATNVTLAQGGTTLATTVNIQRFRRIGHEVRATFRVVAAAGGGAGPIQLLVPLADLPLPPNDAIAQPFGWFSYFKTTATVTKYTGMVFPQTTIANYMAMSFAAAGQNSSDYIGASPAFAIASGHELAVILRYDLT